MSRAERTPKRDSHSAALSASTASVSAIHIAGDAGGFLIASTRREVATSSHTVRAIDLAEVVDQVLVREAAFVRPLRADPAAVALGTGAALANATPHVSVVRDQRVARRARRIPCRHTNFGLVASPTEQALVRVLHSCFALTAVSAQRAGSLRD